jgi:hypothetical protein
VLGVLPASRAGRERVACGDEAKVVALLGAVVAGPTPTKKVTRLLGTVLDAH